MKICFQAVFIIAFICSSVFADTNQDKIKNLQQTYAKLNNKIEEIRENNDLKYDSVYTKVRILVSDWDDINQNNNQIDTLTRENLDFLRNNSNLLYQKYIALKQNAEQVKAQTKSQVLFYGKQAASAGNANIIGYLIQHGTAWGIPYKPLVKQNNFKLARKVVGAYQDESTKEKMRTEIDNAEDLFIGEQLLSENKYREAALLYEKIVRYNPESLKNIGNLVLCYEKLKDYKQAIFFMDHYKKQHEVQFHKITGTFEKNTGRLKDRIAENENRLKTCAGSAPKEKNQCIQLAHYNIKIDQKQIKKLERGYAVTESKNAEEVTIIDHRISVNYIKMGGRLEKEGKFKEAIQSYKQAVQFEANSKVYIRLALVSRILSDMQNALKYVNQSFNIESSPWAYNLRGEIYIEMKQYDKGVQDLKRLSENQHNAISRYYLANGLFHLKQYEEAKTNVDKSIEISKYPEAIHLRAYIRHALGDTSGAESDLLDLKKQCKNKKCQQMVDKTIEDFKSGKALDPPETFNL